MNKIKKYSGRFFLKSGKVQKIFGNIAEGTHAGAITLIASEHIDRANLLVCFEEGASGKIKVATLGDKPAGICTDSGMEGEPLSVVLPGSAESSVLCVAASSIAIGAPVYSAAGGKVSAVADAGCYKVGVALCECGAGGIVEVDTQGFGDRAWQIGACGEHVWSTSGSNETIPCPSAREGDFVMASATGMGVSATVVSGGGSVNFALSSSGTSGVTKITWALISSN